MKFVFRPNQSIVLVGMMGVGKTSIGRRLSKKVNIPFYDSNQEVELAAGCTISDIYELYGEQAFRDAERRVIRRLLKEPPHVLSTGVGAFSDEEVRTLIKQQTVSIWLDASIDSIIARVSRRSHRPQLDQSDPRETLAKLFEEYHKYYEEADIHIDCSHDEPGVTVEKIYTAINQYLGGTYEKGAS